MFDYKEASKECLRGRELPCILTEAAVSQPTSTHVLKALGLYTKSNDAVKNF